MKKLLPFIAVLFIFITCACAHSMQGSVNSSEPTQFIESTSLPVIPTQVHPLPSATPACRQSPGEISHHHIDSTILNKPLSFLVYLPPCYAQNSAKEFPVMYLLHGQTYNQDQWLRLGAVQTAESLIASDPRIHPFLLVMPFEEADLADPYETRFGDALAVDLVPWIDGQYHTCTQRTCRAIAGISRGGAWAVWTGLHYPQLFAVIAGHSFPPFGGDLYRLPTWLRQIPEGRMPDIYLDSGSSDPWLPDTRRFVAVLEQFHVPVTFSINPGDHSESYWQAHIQEYVSQLALYVSRKN